MSKRTAGARPDQLEAKFRDGMLLSEITTIEAADYAALATPKRKYRNEPTEGFDSKAEYRRYQELMLLEAAGRIAALQRQPKYPIGINGVHICTYVGDFRYVEHGSVIVEDVKGVRTPAYKIKRKLMKAVYGIDVKEIAA